MGTLPRQREVHGAMGTIESWTGLRLASGRQAGGRTDPCRSSAVELRPGNYVEPLVRQTSWQPLEVPATGELPPTIEEPRWLKQIAGSDDDWNEASARFAGIRGFLVNLIVAIAANSRTYSRNCASQPPIT